MPVSENEAYVARARELNREMETEMVAQFDQPDSLEDDTILDEVSDRPA